MKYDVALSFAGEDRKYVEEVATELKTLGVRVFYDNFEAVDLWGKELYTHLQNVYQKEAKYTVIFISKYYAQKLWTNHERKMAQARAFTESSEYILPARFDDTEIEGITSTVGYIDLNRYSPQQFAELIKRKTQSVPTPLSAQLESDNTSEINSDKPPPIKQTKKRSQGKFSAIKTQLLIVLVIAFLIAFPILYWQFVTKSNPKDISDITKHQGKVSSINTLSGINGAKIYIEAEGRTQIYYTDQLGVFYFYLLTTTYSYNLKIEAEGYETFTNPQSYVTQDVKEIRLTPIKELSFPTPLVLPSVSPDNTAKPIVKEETNRTENLKNGLNNSEIKNVNTEKYSTPSLNKSIITALICPVTGLRAGFYCPVKKATKFIEKEIPRDFCSYHTYSKRRLNKSGLR